ncbi:MerR family transcriptional regulator [Actinoplanes sp. NPDC049118]|uniref:MerR family transcriptional regulator n=1 Tax=Actinoplanes sp. NPDC049118 TaxID=3155769 RepID=UPI0033CF96FD
MTSTTEHGSAGIRAVAERTGLSVDTLRWYEREGLLPRVERGPDGRRRYDDAALGFLRLVQALRRGGMPVAEVRAFVRMSAEGAASHGRRMSLLERQRAAIRRQQARLAEDLLTVEEKIAHYQDLIDRGLDCGGEPVDEATAALQRRRC